eukprot:Skav231155  [mRNA]  locus=scaffold3252:33702:36594:- [translate_table: standard]
MNSRYRGQSYHVAPGLPKANATAAQIEHEHDDPKCTKFVVFSTQRSGSGWLTNALNQQPEVWCRGELVVEFSRRPEAEVSISANWMDEVDRIFDSACKDARSEGKRIAGFKIMYNQVKGEHHKVNGVDLPREWFKDYLQTRNVRILHLVREAAILSMSSMKLLARDKNHLHLSHKDKFHTKDPDVAALTMNSSTKFYFDQEALKKLREEEHKLLEWTAFLSHLGMPYHYARFAQVSVGEPDLSAVQRAWALEAATLDWSLVLCSRHVNGHSRVPINVYPVTWASLPDSSWPDSVASEDAETQGELAFDPFVRRPKEGDPMLQRRAIA